MAQERPVEGGGGWEAGIDASFAARLLRPAVRPGISDPAHGRTLASRLQRASATSLADDVARRYGVDTLGGNRPLIVHALPVHALSRAPETAPAAGGSGSVAPGRAAPHPVPPPGGAGAPRPTVRAAERT
ncbi:MAG TPA: hypothetical protein VF263_21810, partial [Longimicrobiaceae bacterium]